MTDILFKINHVIEIRTICKMNLTVLWIFEMFQSLRETTHFLSGAFGLGLTSNLMLSYGLEMPAPDD